MSAHLKAGVLKAPLTMAALFALLAAGRAGHRSVVQQIRPPLRFLMFLPSPRLAGVGEPWLRAAICQQRYRGYWFRLGAVVGLEFSPGSNSCCKNSSSPCRVGPRAPGSRAHPVLVFLAKKRSRAGIKAGAQISSVGVQERAGVPAPSGASSLEHAGR